MELRPELLPPLFDEALVARLATLADRLDGARPRESEGELAEFNQLAGTAIRLEEFQGVHGGVAHNVWVRRILYAQHIKPAAGVSRAELAEVVRRAMPTSEYFGQHEAYMAIFDANVPLPNASSLIFYPPDDDLSAETSGGGGEIADYDPTPEQIVDWALGGVRQT